MRTLAGSLLRLAAAPPVSPRSAARGRQHGAASGDGTAGAAGRGAAGLTAALQAACGEQQATAARRARPSSGCLNHSHAFADP
ncbi:hypothetical protein ACP70R_006760 [Stipagrostis hirtigluma subsp. patula]